MADVIACQFPGCGKRKAKILMTEITRNGRQVWVCREHVKNRRRRVKGGER